MLTLNGLSEGVSRMRDDATIPANTPIKRLRTTAKIDISITEFCKSIARIKKKRMNRFLLSITPFSVLMTLYPYKNALGNTIASGSPINKYLLKKLVLIELKSSDVIDVGSPRNIDANSCCVDPERAILSGKEYNNLPIPSPYGTMLDNKGRIIAYAIERVRV